MGSMEVSQMENISSEKLGMQEARQIEKQVMKSESRPCQKIALKKDARIDRVL